MKILSVAAFAILIFAFTSCKSNVIKDNHTDHDMQSMAKDISKHGIDSEDKEVKTVAVLYSNLDVNVATSIKEIVDHYLHVKNALANDNATETGL